jgi:ectoine hydroxylase-related dioxygenase (phytanoyl-CoA dioxygenase family)
LIHGLGIGLEQIARYLAIPRTFEELQEWIIAVNGGSIDRQRLTRLNAAILGLDYDSATRAWLDAIASTPPVLSERDLEMWRELGFVVLHEAISPEECAAAAAFVHSSIGALAHVPETWYSPENKQGIMVQVFQHTSLEAARRSRRVHKAFSQLWGTPDLFVTTDRCGFNPPEGFGFKFPGPHLHWDADLTPPIGLNVQGILYLTDTAENQGAFTCVPGFHRRIDDWLRSLPAGCNPREQLGREVGVALAGPAGDLIIWHHGLPHGSSPNHADKPRVVQYIKMFPPGLEIARVGRLPSNNDGGVDTCNGLS